MGGAPGAVSCCGANQWTLPNCPHSSRFRHSAGESSTPRMVRPHRLLHPPASTLWTSHIHFLRCNMHHPLSLSLRRLALVARPRSLCLRLEATAGFRSRCLPMAVCSADERPQTHFHRHLSPQTQTTDLALGVRSPTPLLLLPPSSIHDDSTDLLRLQLDNGFQPEPRYSPLIGRRPRASWVGGVSGDRLLEGPPASVRPA